MFIKQHTMCNCLFRQLAVYDEADGDIDWAARQMEYVQASIAAELAGKPIGFNGAQPGSHISHRYVASYPSHVQIRLTAAAIRGPEQSLEKHVLCLCNPYNMQPVSQLNGTKLALKAFIHNTSVWHIQAQMFKHTGQIVCCQCIVHFKHQTMCCWFFAGMSSQQWWMKQMVTLIGQHCSINMYEQALLLNLPTIPLGSMMPSRAPSSMAWQPRKGCKARRRSS